MKVFKAADLESVIGKAALDKVAAEIAKRKAKPPKPPKTYAVVVDLIDRYGVEIPAKNEREARKLAQALVNPAEWAKTGLPKNVTPLQPVILSRIAGKVRKPKK